MSEFTDLLADWGTELPEHPTPAMYIHGCPVFLVPAYDEDTGEKTHILEISGSEEEQQSVRGFLEKWQ